MRQSVHGARLLATGDFVIRHFSDENEWRCWLVGVYEPYASIIGRGQFPLQAMKDWNAQAHVAKNTISVKTNVSVVKRRWWKIWK